MNLLSAVIISYNEEQNIARCINSLKVLADEIIVLDAYSTDKTVEIARRHGAIVKQGYFLGHIQQKNSAISLASNNYILSLDADEAVDEQLAKSILSIKNDDFTASAYSMNRCINYCGKFIRRGTWYPDKKIRLFDKRIAKWGGVNPHDKIELADKSRKVVHLRGDILHFSFPTIEKHQEKNNSYSTMAAKQMHGKGRKSNWFKILVNPFWAFIHGFIIRLGFLDGYRGFLISINTAHGTFLKYIKLYHLNHTQQTAAFTTRTHNIGTADRIKETIKNR
ncbi:MAG: glycosyltransferase family 2 protein [Chitinophagaceae bacterium]